MFDERLPSHLWIEAHMRKCQNAGMGVYIVNKGSATGGTVIVKLNGLGQGFRLLTQVTDYNGEQAWMNPLGDESLEESDIDAYIARAIDRDPDVWVIEVEDKSLNNPFEGKILE